MSLCMSENVCITCTGKAIEDTSVVQIDDAVTSNWSQETTAIDEFTFSHVLRHVIEFRDTGNRTVQVDVGAISWVVGIFQFTC